MATKRSRKTQKQETKTRNTHHPTASFSSEPSISIGALRAPKEPAAYLAYLNRTRLALDQIVKEVPASRAGSPLSDGGRAEKEQQRTERVEVLRRRVQQAYVATGGEPADGKWGVLPRLLRLNSTLGGQRWLRTGVHTKPSIGASTWILAKTEAEWNEWEKKREQEKTLHSKIESWQATVESDKATDSSDGTKVGDEPKANGKGKVTTKRQDTVKVVVAASGSVHDLKDPSPLGFNVVKRSSQKLNATTKPKPSSQTPRGNAASSTPPDNTHDVSMRSVRDIAPTSLRPLAKGIADIPESPYLPPSFPSQLATSTPKPNAAKERRPPSPIPIVASSPLSSPPKRVYGRQRSSLGASSPLPSLPPSSQPNVAPFDFHRTGPNKRQRSVTPDRPLKHARTMPPPTSSATGQSSAPIPPSSPPPSSKRDGVKPPAQAPTTPRARSQLPTLTELLASSKKTKLASPKAKRRLSASGSNERTPSNVAVDLKGKAKAKPSSPSIVFEDEDISRQLFDDIPSTTITKPTDVPIGYDIDIDIASPAKSLSSIADSDSESEHDDDDELVQGQDPLTSLPDFTMDHEAFNPVFTSTQVAGADNDDDDHHPPSSSFEVAGLAGRKGVGLGPSALSRAPSNTQGFQFGYNSQIDVEGKVDAVNRFLERDMDVDVDYEGWLRDPTPEDGLGEESFGF